MLTAEQIKTLKKLMKNSAVKGNLANSGMVFESGKMLDSAESWVVTSRDATAHSERMLVTKICNLKGSNYTPGLVMLTVVEPCIMCMSACSQAGYSEIQYIIPAKKYVDKIYWMTDSVLTDKQILASQFSNPIKLTHLKVYEKEFCEVFEEAMKNSLTNK